MKHLILLAAIFCTTASLSGCGMTDKEREKHHDRMALIAKKQIELTRDCMKLAASIERQGDDDVSDIIKECGRGTYSMADRLIPQ